MDLMEEIERLKGQVASLKSKARERPLPEGQEGQGSQTGNPIATGSDQGKGRKAASTGRDAESPTAADACGAGGPPQPPATAGKRKRSPSPSNSDDSSSSGAFSEIPKRKTFPLFWIAFLEILIYHVGSLSVV